MMIIQNGKTTSETVAPPRISLAAGRWKWLAVLALFFVYGVVQTLLKS
ncbi:MAG: hypothetical protein LT106_08975 [Burkholderiaceae bacterium]|nr:hypothetical protein [Burkholderiaceae bacterium]